jgi:hypothetical protein
MRDSNLSLSEFNNFASGKYAELSADFHKHTAMIKDMRKDLDFIFRKIRYDLNLPLTFSLDLDRLGFFIFVQCWICDSIALPIYFCRSLKQRIGDKFPDALAAVALPEEQEEY